MVVYIIMSFTAGITQLEKYHMALEVTSDRRVDFVDC